MQTQQQPIVKRTERFVELDTLKFFALLFILYTHSEGYIIKIPFLEWFRVGMMYTGLGLFIFLSGYGLQYSAGSRIKYGKFDKIQFLKRRLFRIYPLYLVALLTYVVLFHYFKLYHSKWDFSPIKEVLVVHFFSLQTVLYPHFPQIPTLWFIGMLMPFYLFFALTVQNKTLKFILIQLAIFIGLVFCNFSFRMIDTRLLLYYPVFLLGCVCSRKQFVPLKQSQYSSHLVWLSGFLTLVTYFLFKYFNLPRISPNGIASFRQFMSYGCILLYVVASIAFLICLISQYASMLNKLRRYITPISELLYPAYLFHRVVYAVSYYFLLEVIGLSRKTSTFFFPIVTLLVLATAFLIGRLETTLVGRFQTATLRFESRKD